MGNHFGANIKLTIKLFDSLISPYHGGEIWGIDCNGKLDTDPAELVQIKWLLGVNKYCTNRTTNYSGSLRAEAHHWRHCTTTACPSVCASTPPCKAVWNATIGIILPYIPQFGEISHFFVPSSFIKRWLRSHEGDFTLTTTSLVIKQESTKLKQSTNSHSSLKCYSNYTSAIRHLKQFRTYA